MHSATRSTCVLCVVVLAACTDDSTLPPTAPSTGPPIGASLAVTRDLSAHTAYSGGSETVPDSTSEAFGHPFDKLSGAEAESHETGDTEFETAFAPGAPSSGAHTGLGPVFDNVSCEGCHVADGRGRPPADGVSPESFLVRISYPGRDATGGPNSVPGFGGQLQFHAITGVIPEANLQIQYSQVTGRFADGSTYTLH